jgi:beta-lactamase regulating signal transducer with metallopeptidase domain
MNVLNQSAFLKALGWALLDSFWQMGILWLLYVLLTGNGRRFQSPRRHTLALISLAAGSIWFLITLIFHFSELVITNGTSVYILNNNSSIDTEAYLTSFGRLLEPALPYLSIAYLGAIIFLFIRLYRQYYVTQKLFSTGTYKVDPDLRVFLQTIAARMGIKKSVRIWLSDFVDTPLTIGFWKPVILLPVAVINHLSVSQAEAIVLHELNHIRRNDYLINLLIACMDIILFFNPFVRILTHIIKNERENSCDDMVLQFRYDAGQYAQALLLLEKNRIYTPALTIAATGKSKKLLLNRVERLLNKKSSGTPISQKLIAFFLSALLLGSIGWYNPGKVIITSVETKENVNSIKKEEQLSFGTPPIVKPGSDAQAPLLTTKERTDLALAKKETEDQQPDQLFEQVLEWIADQSPQKLTETTETVISSYDEPLLNSYIAGQPEMREFSITENSITVVPDYRAEIHPYVPSTSFSYQIMEDTALPKKYIPTPADIKAKESLSAAIKALHEIDWQSLEKEMNASGKNVDIIKLQRELKKALEDVDWKKINEEMQSSLIHAENELLQENTTLQNNLQKFQKDRMAKLEQKRKIEKTILQEHLCEEKATTEKPVKKKTVRAKKIIYI